MNKPTMDCRYQPDSYDKRMCARLKRMARTPIRNIKPENEECVYGTIYHDRWGMDHTVISSDVQDFMDTLAYQVDPRDWSTLIICVFVDPDFNCMFYRYKEALDLFMGGDGGVS